MDLAIAIAHIVGAVIAVMMLAFLRGLLLLWRNEQRAEDAAAVGYDEANGPPATMRRVTPPFSLSRRLLRAAPRIWSWAGLLLMFAVVAQVTWATAAGNLNAARHAWLLLPIFISFEVTGFIVTAVTSRLVRQRAGSRKPADAPSLTAARPGS